MRLPDASPGGAASRGAARGPPPRASRLPRRVGGPSRGRDAWYLANVARVEHGWIAGLAGLAIAAAAAGGAPRASADELELAFGEGRVTLIATGVPLGDVLAEWARAGGTRFEGAAGLGGPAVSLHLEDVAELEALRLLLRPAAGFLAAPRLPRSPGASIYDRSGFGPRGGPRSRLRPSPGSVRRGRPVPSARPRRRSPRRISASGCCGCSERGRLPRWWPARRRRRRARAPVRAHGPASGYDRRVRARGPLDGDGAADGRGSGSWA